MKVLISIVLLLTSVISNAQNRGPVLEMRDVFTEEQFGMLSDIEKAELTSELNEFNNDPYVRVAAADTDRVYGKAFCIGGKSALVVAGIQGFKCITTTKQVVNITMSNGHYAEALSGFMAESYVGLNVGLSVLAGVAILSAPAHSFRWTGEFRRGSYSDKTDVDGGTINGAFGLYGGYAGYFERGAASLTILAYQAGLAVEVSASKVQVKSDRD